MLSKFEVWADLRVSSKCVEDISDFFFYDYGITKEFIMTNLHLTVYHCRRPMPHLQEEVRKCHLSVDTYDTRFMVLAPGGENPRPDIIPGRRKVGIRIQTSSPFRVQIERYRNELLEHETSYVLGTRNASTRSKNAFGARYFQPHISLLRAGSGVRELSNVGENFRESIPEIQFDRFVVRKVKNF